MTLFKLSLAPDQAGYSVEDGEETLSVRLDGGLSRYRKDIVGAASSVRVQWTIGPTDWVYLRAFYRAATNRGTQPFLIDLIMDDVGLTEHEAYFVPGTMRLVSLQGLTYTVQARLEVRPSPTDSALDEAYVALYEADGDAPSVFLSDLERLVNLRMPATIGA